MRILLDENIPFGMRRLLGGHDVKHVSEESWGGLSNGSLIAVAEAAGYEVLLTADETFAISRIWRIARSPSWCSAQTIGKQSAATLLSLSRRWWE
jgi:predicted nuclease of predicted toxin-antitoxin system